MSKYHYKEPEDYKPPQSAKELVERYKNGERYFKRAKLRKANLQAANLEGCILDYADLTASNLHRTVIGTTDLLKERQGFPVWMQDSGSLCHAELTNSDLSAARLTGTKLIGANLRYASLEGADLRGSNLLQAFFHSTKLKDANLSRSWVGDTTFVEVDLSACQLQDVFHLGRSNLSTFTLEFTAEGIAFCPSNQAVVEAFLRNCALDDEGIFYFRTFINKPVEFYSCFISYSHDDKLFAHRLHDQLQARGVRCWLDDHQILAGDNLYDAVNRGIRLWDKVLLCCSSTASKL